MSAVAYKFKCAVCGTEFEAPEVPEMSYGLFVMRSPESDDSAYLDAPNDPVFLESKELVRLHVRLAQFSAGQVGKVQQAVFSVTCDKTADGASLEIGLPPKCPTCGSHKPASWLQLMPARAWFLPAVRHELWKTRSPAQKALMIDEAVNRFLDKPDSRHGTDSLD